MSHLRFTPRSVLALPLFVLLAACPNSVGVTCRNGGTECNDDLFKPQPDLAVCYAECAPKGGCCDRAGKCYLPDQMTDEFCGTNTSLPMMECMNCITSGSGLCISGHCQCGDSNRPCGGGEICKNGTCTCDLSKCSDGCCDKDGNCVKPVTQEMCAKTAGVSCLRCLDDLGMISNGCELGKGCTCFGATGCSKVTATTCDSNMGCKCGTGGACNAMTATCETSNGTSACRCGGGPPCDISKLGEKCVNGQCHCGTLGVICAAGLQCVNGKCMCTIDSCSQGCCVLTTTNGPICKPAGTACGTGAGCLPCGTGQVCFDGVCK